MTNRGSRAALRRTPRQLQLESLEDRRLLAVVTNEAELVAAIAVADPAIVFANDIALMGEVLVDMPVNIDGDGFSLTGSGAERVLNIDDGSGLNLLTVNISNLTITGGSSVGEGGGILSFEEVTLDGVTVTNNAAMNGGGIAVSDGSLYLVRSSVSDNTGSDGGGIAVGEGASAELFLSTASNNLAATGNGGGISLAEAGGDASLLLRYSTIAGNLAANNGGGILAADCLPSAGGAASVTIENSTISGNTAMNGGGIYASNIDVSLFQMTGSGNYSYTNGGFMTLQTSAAYASTVYQAVFTVERSTIAYNQTLYDGGGIYSDYYSETSIDNTIVAANIAGSGGNDLYAANPMIDMNFVADYTLVSDSMESNIGGGVGNLLNLGAQLNPLANNGGPTLTHLPMAGSSVIDAGDPTVITRDDQRGYAEVGRLDIGSVAFGSMGPDCDCDNDGDYDQHDIDLLNCAIANGLYLPGCDLTKDGVLSVADRDAWLDDAGNFNIGAPICWATPTWMELSTARISFHGMPTSSPSNASTVWAILTRTVSSTARIF